MARFLSKYRKYTHGARNAVVENYATGKQTVLVPELEAVFEPRLVTESDKEIGVRSLKFAGLPEDRESNHDISPVRNLSVFDSEIAKQANHWSDEDHDIVVAALRNSPMNGIEFIELEIPKLPAPWSGYDKLESVDRIIDAVAATGVNPNEVLAYERENRDRDEIVEMLKMLAAEAGDEPGDEGVVIEA